MTRPLTEVPEARLNNAIHTLAHTFFHAKELAQRLRHPDTDADEALADVKRMIGDLQGVERDLR